MLGNEHSRCVRVDKPFFRGDLLVISNNDALFSQKAQQQSFWPGLACFVHDYDVEDFRLVEPELLGDAIQWHDVRWNRIPTLLQKLSSGSSQGLHLFAFSTPDFYNGFFPGLHRSLPIRLVAEGSGYVEPDLGARLVTPNGSPALEPLSERERDIIHLLALGYTNQEIGKTLFISVRTVDTHRAHIMRKLRLETRAELVSFALANGLIGPN